MKQVYTNIQTNGKIGIILFTLLLFNLSVYSNVFPQSGIQFLENKGQWENNIRYRADIPIGNLFIENNRLTYLFVDKATTHEIEHGKKVNSIHFHSVRVSFPGSNPFCEIRQDERSNEYYNFFKGSPSTWASYVYAYKKLTFIEFYPKIDMELSANHDGIKINFKLKPGADLSSIREVYEGADQIFLKDGSLHIVTSMGELTEEKPVSFQGSESNQKVIPTRFVLNKNEVQFAVNQYNPGMDLVLDPAVVFGTYVGSAADNFGFAAGFDEAGNAFGAGTVYAANFPVTPGAFDISFAGGNSANSEYARDAFVAKFNPTGTTLLFATFLGGTDNEQPHSVTTAPGSGDVLVFGTTNSNNYPVSTVAFDKTHNGGSDIFVTRLSNNGATLIASTFVGGTDEDGISGEAHIPYSFQVCPLPYNYADWYRGEITVDKAGNVYLATCTKSTHTQGLPLINASQPIYGGGFQDGYIVKLTGNLASVLFSSYIGGTGDDAAYSVCINNLNEPVFAGGSTSNLAYNTTNYTYSGNVDGFVAKFSASGVRQRIVMMGSAAYDQAFFVQTDESNNIYTVGQTAGSMNRSAGTYGLNNAKQFLQKYNSDLSNLLLSTTFGKAGSQPSLSPSAFLVDVCGRIYISGWGGGTNYSYHSGVDNVYGLPVTPDAFQSTSDGSDFYLIVLAPDFANLLYATFYGGGQSQEHVDGGTSHFDKSGIVYQAVCAGCGGLSDFPTTPNAYSRINPGKRAWNTNVGGCNLGLFKFDMRTYLSPPVLNDTTIVIEAGTNLVYDFYATDAGGDLMTMTWTGDVLSRPVNPASLNVISSTNGLLQVRLNWQSGCEDTKGDTILIDLSVLDGACPVPNEKKASIKIVVKSTPIDPPFLECIRQIDNNTLNLSWITNPSVSNFLNYQLIRSVNPGNAAIIDSIANQTSRLYTDTKALNSFTTNYCYQIVTFNNCRLAGDSSRKICSLFTDTISDPGFSNLNEELIIIHAFDNYTGTFTINDTDPKDSVFITASGSMITGSHGLVNLQEGLGSATVNITWQPGCEDVLKDTFNLKLFIRDNTCPGFRTASKLIRFLVVPVTPPKSPAPFCPKKINSDSIFLEWPVYPAVAHTKQFFLIREIAGQPQVIASFTNLNATSFLDVFPYNEAKKTCYKLTSVDECGYYSDTGLATCVQSVSTPAHNLTVYTATVVNDKEVNLIWEKANPDSFWRYYVYRRTGRFGIDFKLVSEIRTLTDTSFKDPDVSVDEHSYCYRLINVDICGNLSQPQKEACTILLKGTSVPFTHSMDWLPYEYWDAGVQNYEVLKTEPDIYTDKPFANISEKIQICTDNKLNYDNGLYQYTVVAHENDFGFGQQSRSNTIDLVQSPYLYAPNAYTENNDGLNDVFITVPVFVRDFHIQIYNRWGMRIFESYDKKKPFNGQYDSTESKSDVYFYIVDYMGWDNIPRTLKGNFTLLR